jgi:hypothetical protein
MHDLFDAQDGSILATRRTSHGNFFARLPGSYRSNAAAIEVALDRAEESGAVVQSELVEMWDDYNWREAIQYAEGFSWGDICRVVASDDGENDEAPWVAVFELHDGRFARLSAGCDYTGWDCQASGDSSIADTLAELVNLCMSPDERERLGLDLEVVRSE